MLFIIGLLKVVLVIVCLLIVLLVMMQRPKQEGLGAAFAQGMMNEIGGAHTANILQKGTTYLGVMFFGISLLLSVLISYDAQEERRLGDAAAASIGDKSGEAPIPPTQPLDFSTPDLGKIPGVDTPLGGVEPEEGDTTPEGGTTPETPEGGTTTPGSGVNPEDTDTNENPDTSGTNPPADPEASEAPEITPATSGETSGASTPSPPAPGGEEFETPASGGGAVPSPDVPQPE